MIETGIIQNPSRFTRGKAMSRAPTMIGTM